ncbi:MAG: hypothetical protein ACRDRP_14070 [Pseudonocardiaceae bacterium]
MSARVIWPRQGPITILQPEIRALEIGDWPTAYGVKPDGAVLVRPDAFVAWRSTDLDLDLDPGAVLAEVLDRATGRAVTASPMARAG